MGNILLHRVDHINMRVHVCAVAYTPTQSAKQIILIILQGWIILVVLPIFDRVVTTDDILYIKTIECEMTMHAYQQTPWKVT
jgi:hypothetical protein